MDVYTSIAALASTYEDLNNALLSDPCTTTYDQVYRQENYRDAYEKLKEAGVENFAIQTVADSVSEKVFSRLRGLIRENIRIYGTRKTDFSSIGFDKLYSIWDTYLFGDQRALLVHDRETITNYPYPTERERELLLQENRVELNNLDNERDAYRKELLHDYL